MLRYLFAFAPATLLLGSPLEAQEAPSDTAALQRMAELGAMASDRSTPDRAIRSYFLFLNNREESSCLQTLLHRRHVTESNSPLRQADTILDSSRNQFFSGLALRVLSRRYNDDFATCMRNRDTYSYEIQGVEPIGLDRTRIVVLARNTTPISPAAQSSRYSMEARAEGARIRFDLVKQGDDWKITQIEQWERYLNDWQPQFREEELQEQVPAYVPVRPY